MNVFISYGHDEFAPFISMIRRDLLREGFDVWIDDGDHIRKGSQWEHEIEQGLTNSDKVILFMTHHSVRRPDGVCLDEVSYARFHRKSIIPVLVQCVDPPLCIARIQYVDIQHLFDDAGNLKEDSDYETVFKEIVSVLQDDEHLCSEGSHLSLMHRLKPLDNDPITASFTKEFVGRTAVLDAYDDWYHGRERLLWISGGAGTGKTALSARICESRPEVKAVHFCRHNDQDRSDAKRAIMSIAFHLSSQMKDYCRHLSTMPDLEILQEKTVENLFESLLSTPLLRIKQPSAPCVIVVDALDEAAQNGRNELCDVIANRIDTLPPWIKMVVTGRPDAELSRRLSESQTISLDDLSKWSCTQDIERYCREHIDEEHVPDDARENVCRNIAIASNGMFLYAKTVVAGINQGRLSPSCTSLPKGMSGVFLSYFDRMMKDAPSLDYRRHVTPLMEAAVASFRPLCLESLIDISELDEYDAYDVLDAIEDMWHQKDERLVPLHKSLVDWLTNPKEAGRYRISSKKGHERMARYCRKLNEAGRPDDYVLAYYIRHCIGSKDLRQACDLLSNISFQKARIVQEGRDSAIRHYLFELADIAKIDGHAARSAMESSCFREIVTSNRRYFYDMGLFFNIRELGYSTIAQNIEAADAETSAMLASYFYITESFDLAIEKATIAEKSADATAGIRADVGNILGLCYRKKANFESARHGFESALRHSLDHGNNYESACAYANIAKIDYHELKWEEAFEHNNQAMKYLRSCYAVKTEGDEKTSLLLFIAEFHRLSAECLIWAGCHDEAREHLDEASEIYTAEEKRDRYFLRYRYTSAFLDIAAHGQDTQAHSSECLAIIKEAVSTYDRAQGYFYLALSYLAQGRLRESADAADEAYRLNENIGAVVEMGEAALVKRACLDTASCTPRSTCVSAWLNYVEVKINRLKGACVG